MRLEAIHLAVEEMPTTSTINTRATSPDLFDKHPTPGAAFPAFPPGHDDQLAVIGNHCHPVLASVTFAIFALVCVPAFTATTTRDSLALWASAFSLGPVPHRDEASTQLSVAIQLLTGPCLELFQFFKVCVPVVLVDENFCLFPHGLGNSEGVEVSTFSKCGGLLLLWERNFHARPRLVAWLKFWLWVRFFLENCLEIFQRDFFLSTALKPVECVIRDGELEGPCQAPLTPPMSTWDFLKR